MDAVRERLHGRPLVAGVVDPDLGVGHAPAEPGLGVRLVLDLAVAPGGACKVVVGVEEEEG